MRILKTSCILFIYFLSLLSCKKEEKSVKFSIAFEQNEERIIEIENTGDRTAKFKIIVNGLDLSDYKNILSFVKSMPSDFDGEPLELKAFRFVRDYTWHDDLITKYNWAYSPYLMINSLGGGLCGFRASVLTNILKDLGFDARAWGLNGHVVSEVFSDGKWKMFDADYGVYYFNELGEIASYKELCKNPKLITNPINPILTEFDLKYANCYSASMASLYYTKDDNIVFFTDYPKELRNAKMYLYLPPGAKITCLFNVGLTKNFTLLELELPDDYTGNIEIPLAIALITGKGEISVGDKKFNIENFDSENVIFKNPEWIGRIKVSKNHGGIRIYYFINPLVYGLGNQNEIMLVGFNVENLKIQKTNRKDIHFKMPFEKNFLYNLIDEKVSYVFDSLKIDSKKEYCFDDFSKIFFTCLKSCESDKKFDGLIDFNKLFLDYDSLVYALSNDTAFKFNAFLQKDIAVQTFLNIFSRLAIEKDFLKK